MLQTVEAIIDPNGSIHLLEPVNPKQPMRAFITLVEPIKQEEPKTPLSQFAGLLKNSKALSGNPVAIQQTMRDEWND